MNDYILVLGARHFKDSNRSPGGVVALFEDFLAQLDNLKISYYAIDLNKKNYKNLFIALIKIFYTSIVRIPKSKIVFLHGTANDYIIIAPIILTFSKIFGKKFFLRKFAGNFDLIYRRSNILARMVIRYVISNSDGTFWETKRLIDFWSRYNRNSFWFPNVRKKSGIFRDLDRPYSKKIIYLGQISKEKGVDILLNAKKYLDQTYEISFYGEIIEPIKKEDFSDGICFYRGFIKSDEVPATLSKYDLLVLPSGREEEGYPGVIIEAYMAGLPVIATNIGGIPEIVQNYETGLLTEPGNEREFFLRLLEVDESLHMKMRRKAFEYSEFFDSSKVTKEILNKILNIN